MGTDERRAKGDRARARALRAARVVTVAAAMLLGPAGCSESHGPSGADGGRGTDSGSRPDSGRADAGPTCPAPDFTSCCEPMTRECCDALSFGSYDETAGCCLTCVVGPLVPPSAPV